MYILSIVILYYYRASKRTNKSESWSSYREALEEVERQEAQIDKLKATLNNTKRNVEYIGAGALAHLVERFHGMEEVRGSSSLSSTTHFS